MNERLICMGIGGHLDTSECFLVDWEHKENSGLVRGLKYYSFWSSREASPVAHFLINFILCHWNLEKDY